MTAAMDPAAAREPVKNQPYDGHGQQSQKLPGDRLGKCAFGRFHMVRRVGACLYCLIGSGSKAGSELSARIEEGSSRRISKFCGRVVRLLRPNHPDTELFPSCFRGCPGPRKGGTSDMCPVCRRPCTSEHAGSIMLYKCGVSCQPELVRLVFPLLRWASIAR